MTGYQDGHDHLADELRRLDLLIGLRLGAMSLQNEAFPREQAARTVYITRQEVDWLLADDAEFRPGFELTVTRVALKQLGTEIDANVRATDDLELPLVALGRRFGLSGVELSAVVVCLAPELRRKYDRLYAYLQDDITRQRPSADLVLSLLCETERERWRAAALFSETAPLLRHGILRTADDPQSPSGSSDLARFLTVEPRIRRFLLGDGEPDVRLTGRARVHPPTDPVVEPDPVLAGRLLRLVGDRPAPVCYLHGPAGTFELARYAAGRLGLPLVSVDARALAGPDSEFLLGLAVREGVLHGAALYVADADTLPRSSLSAVEGHDLPVFLAGEPDWPATGAAVHRIAVPLPDPSRSTTLWHRSLAGHTADAAAWAADLTARYQLSAARVEAAVRDAGNQVRMEAEPRALTLADVSAACRRQSGRALGQVAVKVVSRRGWDDLVLPADRIARLRNIGDQVRHRGLVLHNWGFGAQLGHGTGLSVLFSGPPGTGKTMAAEVLAHDLDVDLYKADLSGVVSKYVGETEKNLARIFAEARTANAILFFDEADALFGKRTEVSDAHDRYANIETSYLLQRLEEHEGVVVLATNLRQNIDDAFTRRLRFVVEFPFPEVADRQRIWRTLFPPDAPLAPDVDFARLAKDFPVTGANIRNIVLNAAFLAAADGGAIGWPHIRRGAREEFEKIGKLWPETAVGSGVGER